METITRHVRDIDAAERRMLEHVIGQQLKEDQKVIIQIVALENEPAKTAAGLTLQPRTLPEWCNVFDGLAEEQIAEVEEFVRQRSNLARPSE